MCGRKRLDRAWSEASSVIETLGRSECGVGVEWGSPSSFKLTPSADRQLSILILGPAGTLVASSARIPSVPLLWTGVPTSGRQEPLPMFRCPGHATTNGRVFPDHLIK